MKVIPITGVRGLGFASIDSGGSVIGSGSVPPSGTTDFLQWLQDNGYRIQPQQQQPTSFLQTMNNSPLLVLGGLGLFMILFLWTSRPTRPTRDERR